jgi:uncharacterized integral membrane protein (TIGR00697 family)
MTEAAPLRICPSLLLFATSYGGMTCIAGVLGNKLFAVGPLAAEGGIVAFLLLVVLSSATAELYGRTIANRLVLFGFVPLLASMALIQLVLALPPAPFWGAPRREAFTLLLSQSFRLMLAGIIAYGASQLLNVFVFARLRGADGRHVWLRSLVAGVVSQSLDTVLFITIAFYGQAPLLAILPGQWLAKVILSAIFVPPATILAIALARRLDSSVTFQSGA